MFATIPKATMTVFSLLFGLALGSFINVCIHRIPLRKSIIAPSSHCPGCGMHIRFYDNIPIVSYLILLGKCRYCRGNISILYPIVELLTGLLSVSLFLKYFPEYHLYILFLIFSALLVIISFIDLRLQIIPDIVSIPGIIAGLALSFLFDHINWIDAVLGIIGGGGILYLVAVIFEKLTGKEGMGGGDIKLLAMIGSWMGWRAIPFIILISSIAGIIIGGGTLLLSRQGLRVKIPFGPFLSLGALVYLFFGHQLVALYFRLFIQ